MQQNDPNNLNINQILKQLQITNENFEKNLAIAFQMENEKTQKFFKDFLAEIHNKSEEDVKKELSTFTQKTEATFERFVKYVGEQQKQEQTALELINLQNKQQVEDLFKHIEPLVSSFTKITSELKNEFKNHLNENYGDVRKAQRDFIKQARIAHDDYTKQQAKILELDRQIKQAENEYERENLQDTKDTLENELEVFMHTNETLLDFMNKTKNDEMEMMKMLNSVHRDIKREFYESKNFPRLFKLVDRTQEKMEKIFTETNWGRWTATAFSPIIDKSKNLLSSFIPNELTETLEFFGGFFTATKNFLMGDKQRLTVAEITKEAVVDIREDLRELLGISEDESRQRRRTVSGPDGAVNKGFLSKMLDFYLIKRIFGPGGLFGAGLSGFLSTLGASVLGVLKSTAFIAGFKIFAAAAIGVGIGTLLNKWIIDPIIDKKYKEQEERKRKSMESSSGITSDAVKILRDTDAEDDERLKAIRTIEIARDVYSTDKKELKNRFGARLSTNNYEIQEHVQAGILSDDEILNYSSHDVKKAWNDFVDEGYIKPIGLRESTTEYAERYVKFFKEYLKNNYKPLTEEQLAIDRKKLEVRDKSRTAIPQTPIQNAADVPGGPVGVGGLVGAGGPVIAMPSPDGANPLDDLVEGAEAQQESAKLQGENLEEQRRAGGFMGGVLQSINEEKTDGVVGACFKVYDRIGNEFLNDLYELSSKVELGGHLVNDVIGNTLLDEIRKTLEDMFELSTDSFLISENVATKEEREEAIQRARERKGTDRKELEEILTTTPVIGSDMLGSIAALGESGTAGSMAIGYDSKGGTSYGKYQIAAKTGTMNKFLEHLKETDPEAAAELLAAGPLDTGGRKGAAVDVWKRLASEGRIQQAEHNFIKESHFDPAAKHASKLGFDLNDPRIQEMIWSGAVQHGGINKILSTTAGNIDLEQSSTEEILSQFYKDRGEYALKYASDDTHRGILNRYRTEEKLIAGMSISNMESEIYDKENKIEEQRSQDMSNMFASLGSKMDTQTQHIVKEHEMEQKRPISEYNEKTIKAEDMPTDVENIGLLFFNKTWGLS